MPLATSQCHRVESRVSVRAAGLLLCDPARGLHRAPGARQTAAHSWQSEHRWSRWTLLELTRHPAHHLEASKPFWQLQPYDDAPQLPTGYYGCFWVALVPPLWRRLIHPRLPAAGRAGS